MTDGKEPTDDTTLLNMLYPSVASASIPHEPGDAIPLTPLMEELRLNLNQRLEVMKILNLQAIERHLAMLARRAQLILEQMVASQTTRDRD